MDERENHTGYPEALPETHYPDSLVFTLFFLEPLSSDFEQVLLDYENVEPHPDQVGPQEHVITDPEYQGRQKLVAGT